MQLEIIKEALKKEWYHLYDDLELPDIDRFVEANLSKPFESLPPQQELSKEEVDWLIDNEQNGWEGEDFLKMRQLRLKKGLSKESHAFRRKNFLKIHKQCKDLGLQLPKNFVKLLLTDKYIDRLRVTWTSFIYFPQLINFPEIKGIYLLPFHEDDQGCCTWYLVFNKKGEHFIFLYPDATSSNYQVDFKHNQSEMLLCAETIEEFIIRLSLEIRIKEGESFR